MVLKNDNKSCDNNTPYIATTDENTAKQLILLGYEIIKHINNRWVFKNNIQYIKRTV